MGLTKAYIETSLVYGTVFSQALLTFSISYLTENSPIPEAAVYTHLFANLILPPPAPQLWRENGLLNWFKVPQHWGI